LTSAARPPWVQDEATAVLAMLLAFPGASVVSVHPDVKAVVQALVRGRAG